MGYSQTLKQTRKRKQKVSNISLPDDVIFNNIIIRLPSKQVARFRSVSKLWNSVLSQQSFIKSHLHHSIQSNKHNESLLIFHNRFSFDKQPYTSYCGPNPIKLPVNASSYVQGDNYVIGSVNGLICFANYSEFRNFVIYIWNPSLSALLALPPYTFTPRHDFGRSFRFGFDPKTNDYKVVKVTYRRGTMFKKWIHVEVYSMRKGGSWKVINQRHPSHMAMIYNDDEQYCVKEYDGYLHWFGYVDDHRRRQAIVAFDLRLEIFSEISLPDSIDADYSNSFGVLDGKLCVMSYSAITKDDFYEVWVMNEYGVAESWVKNHVFSRFSGTIHPFGFTLNNVFMFEALGEPLALYDAVETKVDYLDVSIIERCRTKVVQYVDSLVWVSPAKKGATFIDSKLGKESEGDAEKGKQEVRLQKRVKFEI